MGHGDAPTGRGLDLVQYRSPARISDRMTSPTKFSLLDTQPTEDRSTFDMAWQGQSKRATWYCTVLLDGVSCLHSSLLLLDV